MISTEKVTFPILAGKKFVPQSMLITRRAPRKLVVTTTLDIAENYSPRDGRDFYVETLQDLNLDPIMVDGKLNSQEIGKRRAALCAFQWLVVQTLLLPRARCNLALSDLARQPSRKMPQEIQSLMNIPFVSHWQQMVVITLGDQAPTNRPDGVSTGGFQEPIWRRCAVVICIKTKELRGRKRIGVQLLF